MSQIKQSRPDSGLGFQAEILKTFAVERKRFRKDKYATTPTILSTLHKSQGSYSLKVVHLGRSTCDVISGRGITCSQLGFRTVE